LPILFTDEYSKALKEALIEASERIVVCSAFIKLNALTELLEGVNVGQVSIVGRWQKRDLLAGVSDLEVFELCESSGWKFGIDLNLHGKLFIVDNREVFLGSANMTSQGLGLGAMSNLEFGTRIEVQHEDLSKISNYLGSDITWLDPAIYSLLVDEIDNYEIGEDINSQQSSWGQEIMNQIAKPVEHLWVNELVHVGPDKFLNLDLSTREAEQSFALLGLNIDDLGSQHIKTRFRESRSYMWLIYLVEKHEDCSFGFVTSALHDALLEDPKPYRRDVKQMVSRLFEWAEFLEEDFQIISHRRTKSLRLRNASSNQF